MAAHPTPNSQNGNGKMPPKAAKTKGYTPGGQNVPGAIKNNKG